MVRLTTSLLRLFSRTAGLLTAVSFCALTSCNSLFGLPDGSPTQLTVSISGSFTDAGSATKVSVSDATASDATEKVVNDLQVLVFDLGGGIDGYGHKTGNAPIIVSTHTGAHEVWAVTNFRDLSGITSKTGLMAAVANLSDEIVGDMVLLGGKELNISVNETAVVPVQHLEERAVIRKITNKLSPEALSGQEFRVLDIYLTNAVGDITLDGLSRSGSPVWYNKMGFSSADDAVVGGLLHDAIPEDEQLIALNGSYEKEHRLYMLPNLQDEDNTTDTWGARRTRLVVKASIGSDIYYYPLTLPVGESNRSFEVDELVIARMGSQREETLLPFTSIIYDISLAEFDSEVKDEEFAVSTVNHLVFSEPGVDVFDLVDTDLPASAGHTAVFFSDGGVDAWMPYNVEIEGTIEGGSVLVFVDSGITNLAEVLAELEAMLKGTASVVFVSSSPETFSGMDIDAEAFISGDPAGPVFVSDAASFDAVVKALEMANITASVVVFVSTLDEFSQAISSIEAANNQLSVLLVLGSVSSFEGQSLVGYFRNNGSNLIIVDLIMEAWTDAAISQFENTVSPTVPYVIVRGFSLESWTDSDKVTFEN